MGKAQIGEVLSGANSHQNAVALLMDSNILIARAWPEHPNAESVRRALPILEAQGARLCISTQSLAEFYVTVTRPKDATSPGPGWKPAGTLLAIKELESRFELLPDAPEIWPIWKRLVATHGIISKSAHDARLAATALFSEVGVLTANESHFRRYETSGLIVINPMNVEA